MNGTEVLANGSYFKGNFVADQAPGAYSPVYDASNADIYLADAGSDNVTVISTSAGEVVDNIPTPTFSFSSTDPTGVAVDTTNGNLYVTLSSGINDLLVIDPSNQSVVAKIPVPFEAYAVAFDPVDGMLFVAGEPTATTGAVAVVNPTSHAIVATTAVGEEPISVAVDTTTGNVFVPNEMSANVSVLSGTTYKVIDTVALPLIDLGAGVNASAQPVEDCFDATSNQVFVADGLDSGNVTALDASSFAINADIIVDMTGEGPGGTDPDWLACNALHDDIYVADDETSEVIIVDATTDAVLGNISIAFAPTTITYDSGDQDLYTTNSFGNVTVISAASNQIISTFLVSSYPFWLATDPVSGEVYTSTPETGVLGLIAYDPTNHHAIDFPNIPGTAGPEIYDPASGQMILQTYNSTTLIGGVYYLTFLNPTTETVVTDVPIIAPVNGFAYDSANHLVYATLDWGGQPNMIGINSADTIVANITVGSGTGPIAYDSVNQDLYISTENGSQYNITVYDPHTTGFVANISVNATAEGLAFDPHNQLLYASGEFLFGIDVGVTVVNTTTNKLGPTITAGYGPDVYDPTTGDVYVTGYANPLVDEINGTTLMGSIPTGIGPWGIAVSSNGQTVFVADSDGAAVTEIGATVEPTYTITFQETTLPAGTSWSIAEGGNVLSSQTGSISLDEPNGKYAYTVDPVAGYTASPINGNVTVNGKNVVVVITFTAGPSLLSVSVNPPSKTIDESATVSLTAVPSCSPGSCPTSGLTYAWTVNDTLGSLAPTTGLTVTLTAGTTPGVVQANVTATLNGISEKGVSVITISATPAETLVSVAITPASPSVATGGSVGLTATPTCSGESTTCPAGTTYVWSVTTSTGELSSESGVSVTYTAGSTTGSATVTVTATLNDVSVKGTDVVTVTAPTGSSGFGSLVLYGAVAAVVAIVVIVLALLFMRKGRKPGGTGATPSPAPVHQTINVTTAPPPPPPPPPASSPPPAAPPPPPA